MKTILAEDINEAFLLGMLNMSNPAYTVKRNSRYGPVIEYQEPVATTYLLPRQRVLFDSKRDCNPFFHFMEGLWMLAGRRDVKWIAEYSSRIAEFSDDGSTFHGAYGRRMRRPNFENRDQLQAVINILKNDPDSRRAVVQIWDHAVDLDKDSKDIPCNDMVFFKIRHNALDMMVCNRSNDAIWGCYGANAVHFSMIMEYVASMIGVPVGRYTQVSDSLHVYTDNPQWELLKDRYFEASDFSPYTDRGIEPYPMFSAEVPVEEWDNDLTIFMADVPVAPDYAHSFFTEVADPMRKTWRLYKKGFHQAALDMSTYIAAEDWQIAAREWLQRRMK